MEPILSTLRRVLWNSWSLCLHQRGKLVRVRYLRPVLLEQLESRITPNGGGFTDLGNLGLSNVAYSSVAWGDYDSDGDLDVVIIGKAGGRTSNLYRNDGGSFTEISDPFVDVERGSVAWGDYDNDGDLDMLLSGSSSSSVDVTKVYRNDGGTFQDLNANLVGLKSAGGQFLAWGDYDNDGDLDVLITGSVSLGVYTTKIYRNDDGTFVDSGASLSDHSSGQVVWGDYDNDGDLDVLITGSTTGNVRSAKIYQNNAGTFTDVNAGLTGVSVSSAAWGDYDNDGDLDLVIAGSSDSGKVTKVYQNISGTFTDVAAGLPGVDFSSVAWGDYDNDGDLDLFLAGRDGGNAIIARIYENNGGAFTDVGAGLTGVYDGHAAWGDYDGDGDLDLLVTGDSGGFNRITRLYRNDTTNVNSAPSAPTGLQVTLLSSTSVQLSWTASVDSQTASVGLSYNLRVGTSPGGQDVLAPMSLTNGKRTIVQRGLVQTTTWTLTDLEPGEQYLWSVQAIDPSFVGSTFASESSFTTPQFTNGGSLNLTGASSGKSAWGDYDNDGDLDVVMSGIDGGNTPITKLFRNDGSNFTEVPAGFVGVTVSALAWGDYDNDGDLDLLLAGRRSDSTGITQLYRNDGVAGFQPIAAGFDAVRYSSVAWGDYDNDGDLDVLISGRNNSNAQVTQLYRNDGADTFVEVATTFPGVSFGSVAWGDFDNDGDLDLALSGTSASGRVSKIYRNDGEAGFVDASANLLALNNSSMAWGDYDNDGDLDLLFAGQDGGGAPHTKIYQNNGDGTFTDTLASLTGVFYGSVAWGDYDNDGDLDVLVTGRTTTSQRIAILYRNDNGTLTDANVGLTGVDFSSVAWGDFDNDGDLDLLINGRDSSNNRVAMIYRNDETTTNTVPTAPTGLNTTNVSGTSITFNWTAATDAETPSAGLSYNLRVGTTPGGDDVFSTMANPSTGFRRLPDAGPIQGTSYVLKGLTPGLTYYWSVQAIDTAFAGGPFATESSEVLTAQPVFSGLSSPNVFYGSTSTTFQGSLKAGSLAATGNVTVTISGNGITPIQQSGALDGDGDFSIAIDTSALSVQATPYTVTYNYAGEGAFLSASDNSATLTISKANSQISLLASPTSTLPGSPVTLTAEVTSTTTGVPTGSVTFMDGSTNLGTKPLVNGVAELVTSTLPLGSRTITAIYSGDNNFNVPATPGSTNVSVSVPTIVTTQIDNGNQQRSMVRSITLNLSSAIDVNDVPTILALLNLKRTSDNLAVGLNGSLDVTGTMLTLRFSGAGIVGGSLADGRYKLTYDGVKVLGGNQLYRLFGDVDGDADVDNADDEVMRAIRNGAREGAARTTYNEYLDFDDNGVITTSDRDQFRRRIGMQL